MAILKELTDDIKLALRTVANAGDKLDKASRKSFARGANEQTFQFPCLVSSSTPVPMAATMVRNLDPLYASFVQIYLSANGIVDLNYIKNPRQFIAQYQSQFNLESVEDDEMIDEFEEAYSDFIGAGHALYATEDGKIAMAFTEGTITPKISKDLLDGMQTVHSIYNTRPIMEAKEDLKRDILDNYLQSKDAAIDKDALNATREVTAPRISERDIKKINDMKPYVLELKLLATKGDSALSEYVTYNVGVKTTCHLGKSDVMIQNIVYVLKNRDPMFNFIRWTTGELSLLKDLVLNINDIHFNIANRYDPTGRFISTLKRMKKKPVKITSSGLSKVVPFATMVITSYEYNVILNQYGFDLKNITFAKKVMDELYLMCFIIMDEGTQTVDMLLDGSTTGFQTYSLDILEKETSVNSSKLSKELTRMLGGN